MREVLITSLMILASRYRLLPSKRQHRALEEILESQRQLYNAALEERIGAYRKAGLTRTYFDQTKALTEWRKSDPEGRALPPNLQRATLKRLDNAYKAFFRRQKARGRPGFPRFRGKGWFNAFGFRTFSGITLKNGRLRFAGLPGGLRVHLHRPIPEEAVVKSCVFRRALNAWSVSFAVELSEPPLRRTGRAVRPGFGAGHLWRLVRRIFHPKPQSCAKGRTPSSRGATRARAQETALAGAR